MFFLSFFLLTFQTAKKAKVIKFLALCLAPTEPLIVRLAAVTAFGQIVVQEQNNQEAFRKTASALGTSPSLSHTHIMPTHTHTKTNTLCRQYLFLSELFLSLSLSHAWHNLRERQLTLHVFFWGGVVQIICCCFWVCAETHRVPTTQARPRWSIRPRMRRWSHSPTSASTTLAYRTPSARKRPSRCSAPSSQPKATMPTPSAWRNKPPGPSASSLSSTPKIRSALPLCFSLRCF